MLLVLVEIKGKAYEQANRKEEAPAHPDLPGRKAIHAQTLMVHYSLQNKKLSTLNKVEGFCYR
jgi:hypothetical protein